jgi:hypothetical protein
MVGNGRNDRKRQTEFQFHMCVLIHLLHLIHMVFIQKFTRVDIILNENNEYINSIQNDYYYIVFY